MNLNELARNDRQNHTATKEEVRQALRGKIHIAVADDSSLLGTTADTAHLLFYEFSALITKLHAATSLAEVREAAAPFANVSTAFLAKVKAGEVKLPYKVKGQDVVLGEIEQRATAVAEVFESTTDDGED